MEVICKNCLKNMEMIDDSHFVSTSKQIHWCNYCGTVLKLHITNPTKYSTIDILRPNNDTKETWKIPDCFPITDK